MSTRRTSYVPAIIGLIALAVVTFFAMQAASERVALGAGSPTIVVVTGGGNVTSNTTVTLNGTVTPAIDTLTAWFDYGLTANYTRTAGNTTIAFATVSGPQVITANLTALSKNTNYHFRLEAQSAFSAVQGNDATFTTSP